MNWLQKIAGPEEKAAFLFKKYLPMASKIPAVNRTYGNQYKSWGPNVKSIEDWLTGMSSLFVRWNLKYAEWALYQFLTACKIGQAWDEYVLDGYIPDRKMLEINDYLTHGHGRIPAITTPLDDVVKASDAWHEKMAQAEKTYKTNNVLAPLSGGWKLIEVPSEDLKAEGARMQSCVGGYCRVVNEGTDRIVSVRDPQNEPHATLELQKLGDPNDPKSQEVVWGIAQVKGKQNRAQPEYLPQVQEALEKLNDLYNVTFIEEGWGDYLEHEPDEVQIRELASKLNKKHQYHTEPNVRAQGFAEYGVNGDDLEKWVKETDKGAQAAVEIIENTSGAIDKYMKYLLEHSTDLRYELIEELENNRTYYELDEDTDEEEDKENFQDLIRTIEKGDPDTYNGNENDQEFLQDWAIAKAKEGWDLAEWAVDEYEEDIKSKYIQDTLEESDAYHQYNQWYGYYNRLKQQQRQVEKNQRVQKMLTDLRLPIPKWDNPKDFIEEVGRWLQTFPSVQEIKKEYQRILKKRTEDYQGNLEYAKKTNNIFLQWQPQVIQQIPEFANLPEQDQRRIIGMWDLHPQLNQDVINGIRQSMNPVRRIAKSWLNKIIG